MRYPRRFLIDERGQDLIEYTIIMALIAIIGAAIFGKIGSSIGTIWGDGNSVLGNAANAAS